MDRIQEITDLMADRVKSLPAGSKEEGEAVDSLVKLYRVQLDQAKSDLEWEDRIARREMEERQIEQNEFERTVQEKERKIDRVIRTSIEAAGITLPLIFYGIWMKRGFRFEESGSYTSQTFRSLFSKFKPTMK